MESSEKMVTIGVVGASGRTGSKIVSRIIADPESRLGAALVSPGSKFLGLPVEGLSSLRYEADLASLTGCDVVIDFSLPTATVGVLSFCRENKLPLLLATTGLSEGVHAEISRAAEEVAICLASNTSLGATVLGILAAQAAKLLGPSFDCEVLEIHHKMKRDAPSGTAQAVVAQIVAADQGVNDHGGHDGINDGQTRGFTGEREVIFGRSGLRREREIGVVSLRGGDEPGEHTVYFLGDSERIEISHKVKDRAVFASGAVVLAKRLLGCGAGVYSPKELLLRA